VITGDVARRTVGKGADCASVASALGKRMGGELAAESQGLRVTNLRVQGSRGYAFIQADRFPYGLMPMYREGGVWKVGQYTATTLMRPPE
jgi:hypothetical protein